MEFNFLSHTLDIGRSFTGRWLLGLAFSLALVFVCLEYSSSPADYDTAEDMPDDLSADMTLMPAMDRQDMVSVQEASTQVNPVADKVRVVNDADGEQQAATTPTTLATEEEPEVTEAQVTEALPQTQAAEEGDVLTTVEKLPEFPGGIVAFMKWLNSNLKYPPSAQSRHIQGRVVVSFIVNKDGSVSRPSIVSSVDPFLAREVIRVLGMTPHWTPGISDGKPCRTMVVVPVNFQL